MISKNLKKNFQKNPEDCAAVTTHLEEYYITGSFGENLSLKTINAYSIVNIVWLARMDLYTLFRMFTKFEDNKTTPRGCPTPEYDIMKNLVVHAGATHVKAYNYVLLKMGFEQKLNVEDKEKGRGIVDLGAPFNFFA